MSIMAKTPSGYKKIGSAYLGERPVDKVFNANGDVVYALQRELTGVPPLLFKGKEQSELLNYRIYGDTVDGESVGDRTANLIQGSIKNANIGNNGKINTSNEFFLVYAPVATGESYTISNNDGTNVYAFYNAVPSTETATSYDSNRQIFSTSTITFVSPITGYIAVRLANTAQDIMINSGSTAVPYEPVGYRVPVTVEGKNLAKNNHANSSAMFTVEEVNNFIHVSGTNNSGSTIAVIISAGNEFPVGKYDIVNNSNTAIMYDYKNENDVLVSANVNANSIKTFNFPAVFTRRLNVFKSVSNGNSIDNYFQVMIVKHGDDTDTYEPYHAPVTTPIYLPEPIKMVGDEAEYIDYAEQKQHRVRKNLLQNTATSQTVNGVTFTVNADGSITCSGTLTSGEYADLVVSGVFFGDTDILENGNYVVSCANGSNDTYLLVGNSKGEVGRVRAAEINISANLTWAMLRIWQADPAITLYPMIRKADIEDDTYEPYIENTDVDVTLPALPTIKGTNEMSVDTEVQPSRMDIKGRIKTLT